MLDLGCGTGYHLPIFARSAARVAGVEPHHGLAAAAGRRVRGLRNVEVRVGAAQSVPLPDGGVDMVHARWAYYFGPGCEPGVAELDRVMVLGGVAFVIDNDATRSTFGGWFRRARPACDPVAVQRFWTRHGWRRVPVDMGWRFTSRADLESVVRVEFAADQADRIIAGHAGLAVDYAVNLWWRSY